jgi:CRP/FNR family cyclic AMP-dependent transcriptional regulator
MTNHSVYLLDVDPDLAYGLDARQLATVRERARAWTVDLPGRSWDPSELSKQAGPGWFGLFVVRGLMLRIVRVDTRTACELFGPGDVIRPWDADGEYGPLVIELSWRILQPARLAVLDHGFSARVSSWPTIAAVLMSRIAGRARGLALNQAVSHLPHANSRLLVLFWLLGERWGNIGLDGVTITLPLTHETLSIMIGVRRPTVTLAVRRLAEAGLLVRQRRDRWLLTRQAVERLGRVDGLSLIVRGSKELAAADGAVHS